MRLLNADDGEILGFYHLPGYEPPDAGSEERDEPPDVPDNQLPHVVLARRTDKAEKPGSIYAGVFKLGRIDRDGTELAGYLRGVDLRDLAAAEQALVVGECLVWRDDADALLMIARCEPNTLETLMPMSGPGSRTARMLVRLVRQLEEAWRVNDQYLDSELRKFGRECHVTLPNSKLVVAGVTRLCGMTRGVLPDTPSIIFDPARLDYICRVLVSK